MTISHKAFTGGLISFLHLGAMVIDCSVQVRTELTPSPLSGEFKGKLGELGIMGWLTDYPIENHTMHAPPHKCMHNPTAPQHTCGTTCGTTCCSILHKSQYSKLFMWGVNMLLIFALLVWNLCSMS